MSLDKVLNINGSTISLQEVFLSNSNGMSIGVSQNTITFAHSVPADYISSNQSSLFQQTSQMSDYLGTSYSSHTHSQYLTTAMQSDAGSLFINTSNASLYQLIANSSLSLGTEYSSHTHSQYFATSNTSYFALSNHSHGNPSLALTNISGSTASNSNGLTISLSALPAGLADGYNILAAGSQTANSAGTVLLSNSNNITFGMLNSSVVTASASYSSPTDYISIAQSSNFVNTSQSSLFQHTSATSAITSNALNTSQSSLLQHTSLMSNYLGTNYTTHTHTQSNQNISLYAIGNTVQNSSTLLNASNISFNGIGDISVGFSNGSVQLSVVPTIDYELIPANAIAAGSQTASPMVAVMFSNSNNVTFGMSNQSVVTASFSQSVQTQGTYDSNYSTHTHSQYINTSISSNFTTQSVQPVAASASNGSFAFSTLSFGNLNGLSFYTSNGSIVGSYTDAGGGGQTVSTFIPYYPASTGVQTLGAQGTSTASAWAFPVSIDSPVAFNALRLLQTMSFISSTASGQQSISSIFGLFSNNNSTLSRISSGSFSMSVSVSSVSATLNFPTFTATDVYVYGTVTASATNQAQSLFGTAGNRIIDLVFGGPMTLTPGLYWLGVHQRQSSVNANVGVGIALAGNVMAAAQNAGPIGSSTAAMTGGANALKYKFGWGIFTSTGSAGYSGTNLPDAMALSAFNNSVTIMPMMTFIST